MEHGGGEPARPEPRKGDAATGTSKSSAFLTGGIEPEDSKRMVAALRQEILKAMPEMSAALFKYMDGELLELAKDAKSNAEQSEYFAAMSNLENLKSRSARTS